VNKNVKILNIPFKKLCNKHIFSKGATTHIPYTCKNCKNLPVSANVESIKATFTPPL
jgi:hypothetical protein